MKTYAQLFDDIQIFPYSNEMFDLYKEAVSLDFMDYYIDNQLYIREYVDQPNDLLMESLDEDRLAKLITEAQEQSEKWYIKIKNGIMKFFEWMLTYLKKFWAFITSPFRKKKIAEATKTLQNFTNGTAGESQSEFERYKSLVQKLSNGQLAEGETVEDISAEVRKLSEQHPEWQSQVESALNISFDKLFTEDEDFNDKALKVLRTRAAVGSAAVNTVKTAGKAVIGLAKFLGNLKEKLSPATFQELNEKNPFELVALSSGENGTNYTLKEINGAIERSFRKGNLFEDFSRVLQNAINFQTITYHFFTKEANVQIISLKDFVDAFKTMNANEGKGKAIIGSYMIRLGFNLRSKVFNAIDQYSKPKTKYKLVINSIADFEQVINYLHKVLKNMQEDKADNKFNYDGYEDPTKLKNMILGRSGKQKSEIDYKLTGATMRTGNGLVRDKNKENDDKHFNHDLEKLRRGHVQFYSKFSKASANLLKAMQIAQLMSNRILECIPGFIRENNTKKKLTRG